MGKTHVLQRLLLATLIVSATIGLSISILSRSQIDIYPAITFLSGTPPQDVLTPQAYISGAVAAPGVYRIDAQTRVGKLIDLAGGVTADADPNFLTQELNLAKVVADEQHVFIPVAEPLPAATTSVASSTRINLNTASAAQLESLPGIGTSLAEEIIAHRPFASVSDLQEVPGIGDAKYAKLADLVTL